MVCGCKDTVWADHGVLPDVDMGIIHAGQPEVGIDIIAHVWIAFFIGMVLLSLFIRNLSHVSVDSSRFFRYCAGLTPYSFLNTRLK